MTDKLNLSAGKVPERVTLPIGSAEPLAASPSVLAVRYRIPDSDERFGEAILNQSIREIILKRRPCIRRCNGTCEEPCYGQSTF